jgi:hypothetical protein
MSPRLTAVITAGGTVENIDDVRVLGNISKGGFGIEIARALAANGVETTLLGSPDCLSKLEKSEPFATEKFRSYASLKESLFGIIEAKPPSILLMAAAVSDYTPVITTGKIRSDQERLVIDCTRNPKLLSDLRPVCGHETFLVGFKLLSGVTDQELVQTALRQVRSDRLNLTVANDMRNIDYVNSIHPVVIVTPEGGAIRLDGKRRDVARDLVDFCLKRRDVHWFKTTMVRGAMLDDQSGVQDLAATLLKTAQDAHLLIDTNGNVSARAPEQDEKLCFFVSTRQTDKSSIGRDDLAFVEVDPVARAIICHSEKRSSIDSGVQGVLYRHLPGIEAFLHFHAGDALIIPQTKTEFPYPCGTLEEAEEILHALTKARIDKRYSGGPFLLELVDHGYLVGLERNGVQRITKEWQNVKAAYAKHLNDIGESQAMIQLSFAPVFAGPSIVGLIGKHSDGWHTLWLDEKSRKLGHGESFLQQVIQRGYTIGAHDKCSVIDYYTDHGFKVIERKGVFVTLLSPSRRDDLREAASIALVNPATKEMLMGERLVEPYKGFFSFPGGGIESGETPFEAARREFQEETGIALDVGKPLDHSVQYVGWNSGERACRVDNYVLYTENRFPENETAEMRCKWIPIDCKVKAGYGTKAVMRRIKSVLDPV